MNKSQARYLIELGIAFACYAALLALSFVILKNIGIESPTPLRVIVALLPILAVVLVIAAALRYFRRMDELEKRIQLDSLAIAYIGTAFVTFGYGFLEIVGLPRISMFVVWPIMAVLWIIGAWVARRRYGGSGGSHD